MPLSTNHILLSVLFFAAGCKKTVVSDKVVPIAIATATAEPLKKGIGDGVPDTKAVLRFVNANCEAERKSVLSVKVAGLVNTDWITISCSDKTKEVVINSKKGYCNVLQLKSDVSFQKKDSEGKEIRENYVRTTASAADRVFFKVDQPAAKSNGRTGINIHFEDTNDDYWNKAYMICLKDTNATIPEEPITGVRNQACKNIINGYTDTANKKINPVVEWNDFEFTAESDEVQFTVEGFKDVGCNPN
ncbi:MAG: hypothetical protein EBR09_12135 [Proteobacteria bacterium]|nr:hypothetical protein [Pseudomonadota bacterium]